MTKAYLKRFAVLATGFARRYSQDVVYRTAWNVVLLQIGFTLLLLTLIFFSLSVLYDDVIQILISSLKEALLGQRPISIDGEAVAENLTYARRRLEIIAAASALILAAIFSYLMIRLAFTPTKNAIESQKQFVGNIAHELRTPLSIIKTNSEVALFNTNLDADTREIFQSNLEELDRVSDIINNLLSMSRLLRPEKITFTNVELQGVLERVTHSLEEFAERKSITLTTEGTGVVWGNAAALEQIVMNVVKNALNYTSEKGTVSIVFNPNHQGAVDIIITDTGMGIEEKDLEHIFEPFYRGDMSRNRKSGGSSGLGLAIVGELIKLHRGSISISSVLGNGTAVHISLPIGQAEKDVGERLRTFMSTDRSSS